MNIFLEKEFIYNFMNKQKSSFIQTFVIKYLSEKGQPEKNNAASIIDLFDLCVMCLTLNYLTEGQRGW